MGPFVGHTSPTEHGNLEPHFRSPGLRCCSWHSHRVDVPQCFSREIFVFRAVCSSSSIPHTCSTEQHTHGPLLLTHWGAAHQQFCGASSPPGCCAAPNPRALPTSVQCWGPCAAHWCCRRWLCAAVGAQGWGVLGAGGSQAAQSPAAALGTKAPWKSACSPPSRDIPPFRPEAVGRPVLPGSFWGLLWGWQRMRGLC